MLNFRESKKSAQIELTRREIEVALGESESTNLVLLFPPAHELDEIGESYSPKISLREAMKQDPFDLKERFLCDLAVLKEEEGRFGDSSTFLNQLANLSSLTDNEAEARRYLKDAIRLDDDDFFSTQIAKSYITEGNLAAASDYLESIEPSGDADSIVLLAQLALAEQDVKKAEVLIDRALEIDPANSGANIVKGGIRLFSGEPHLAIHYFRRVIRYSRATSDVYVNLAVCHFLLGFPQKAVKELAIAISINPTNENAVVFYSDALFELRDSGRDIAPLLRFVDLNTESATAWNRLARSYYVSGQFNRALDALKHEAALTNDPSVWNNIAVTHWRMSNYRQSEEYYNYAFKLAAKDLNENSSTAFGILKNLTSHYLSLEKFEQALKSANMAVNLAKENDVDDSAIAPGLITASLRTEGVAASMEVASKFLEERDLDVNLRADILARLVGIHGEYGSPAGEVAALLSSAIDYFEKDTELSEQVTYRLANNLMFTCLQLDDLDRAASFASKLTRYVRKDPFVTATFGLLNLKKGRTDKGKELYQSAISLARDRNLKDQIRQRFNFELGRKYLEAGETKKALSRLQRAVNEKLGQDYVAAMAKKLLLALEKPRM